MADLFLFSQPSHPPLTHSPTTKLTSHYAASIAPGTKTPSHQTTYRWPSPGSPTNPCLDAPRPTPTTTLHPQSDFSLSLDIFNQIMAREGRSVQSRLSAWFGRHFSGGFELPLPRPMPPDNQSSETLNAETNFISSTSEMATKLCGVCSSIPAWFWTQKIEESSRISVELQPFKQMRKGARRGCGLCQVLCKTRRFREPVDKLGACRLVMRNTPHIDGCKTMFCRFGEVSLGYINMLPIPASWSPLSLSKLDENSNLLLIRDWFDNCRLNHTSCNNVTRNFLPTRLLDLEVFDEGRSREFEDDIKLVCSRQFQGVGSVPHYITLSHCWGPPEKRPVTTTLANRALRMERIAFLDLPRTFQDAIILTRKLGQRYLWIDSLCIIQDDEKDWANEASMMSEVYKQSWCTLAALSSSNSTGGLRVSSNLRAKKRFILDLGVNNGHDGLLNVRIFEEEPDIWREEYDGFISIPFDEERYTKLSPLRYRAWALQEKELSTRSIHFGCRQLLWECRELKGTSQLPWRAIRDFDELNASEAEQKWAESQPGNSVLSYRMRVHWLNLSQDYSQRSLTNKTDKLLALSGIARSFQKHFPEGKYIAGLWSSHLPLALLWQGEQIDLPQRTTEYIAPSWSWTSHPSSISYPLYAFHNLYRKTGRKRSGLPDKWLDGLEVVSIKGEPKHGDDYGALKEGATLELGGALFFELDSGLTVYAATFFKKDGVEAGFFHPDVSECPQGKLVCLGIFSSEYDGKVTGLILREHIRDGSPLYSRVGYVDGLKPSLWDGSERRQITLI